MAKNERILTIDIGATSIRLCEFEFDENSVIHLQVFAYREYEEELSDGTRMEVVAGVLRQMLAESGARAKKAVISMSGQSALLRFGKIPAMKYNRKQIRQLAKFEAQRNIPFEIQEVIWDYQLIVEEGNEFIDVMSIVIRNDIVEQFTSSVRNVGLDAILVDAAPIACYNAARANGLGNEECVMIVNIGGRSTNLLFLEKDRFYARSIPIAGYSITQQIAKEFGIGLPEAEELKRHHGFVALGGAYAEPASETAAAVSKIIRNVMTRLHGEISRSINIYRSQQGGTDPKRLYLTGGASILTYCDVFFSEKLEIPVEYFNPFPAVEIADSVDKEALSEVAHMFSEPIGLAFRYFSSCPIEINLLPRSMRRQQALDVKKPYLVFSLVVIAIIVFAFFNGLRTSTVNLRKQVEILEHERKRVEPNYNQISNAVSELEDAVEQERGLERFLQGREVWPTIIEEIFRAKPSNVWIDSIQPIVGRIQGYDPNIGMIITDGGASSDTPIVFDAGGGDSLPPGVSSTNRNIDGVLLVCSTIYGDNEEELKAYPPGIKTDFPSVFSAEEGEDDEDEDEDEYEDEDEVEDEDVNSNVMASDANAKIYPQDAFVRNLRNSPLFSSEANMTVINRVEDIAEIPNAQGVSFEVDIKFNYPLSVRVWNYTKVARGAVSTSTASDD